MQKYERRTQVDVISAIQDVIGWKKDSGLDLEDSLQQLEYKNAVLTDTSSGRIVFDEIVLITIFLNGLPKEYDSIKYSLLASEKLTRGAVLSRLQQQETMQGGNTQGIRTQMSLPIAWPM